MCCQQVRIELRIGTRNEPSFGLDLEARNPAIGLQLASIVIVITDFAIDSSCSRVC